VNWLKAMLLMVVLGAILYGVNLVLNKSAPVETPATSGAWTGPDGSIGPPSVSPGTPGLGAPPGNAPPYSGQTPAAQSVYGSGTYPATNPAGSSTGYPAGGYQGATPPVASSATHSGISATPVGLVTNNSNTAPPTAGASTPGGGVAFATAMESATALLRENQLAEGLKQLTLLCDNPQLKPEEAKQLNDLLGRLAGTVVYSRQHLLLPPYEVKPGDRLESIASEYQVPAGLLAKINGIGDPDHLTPGDKLKVIRGPFMALVRLNDREVTLVVQQCFAGRFKLIGVGKDAATLNGAFKVDRKVLGPEPVNNPAPGSVHHWINFGNQFGFCGLSDPNAAGVSTGFTLNSRDAEDLFDILSVGSTVDVR
jgi:hypothetical protein